MSEYVEIELNKNNIIVLDKDRGIELATQEYFNGNTDIKVNGSKFDIFKFGQKETVMN